MSNILFIEYPKCSTCKKAKKWLEDHGVSFEDRYIVEQNPTAAELKAWHEKADFPIRRFFNTSGMLYREQGIKAKLDADMPDDEMFELLATNGMLVKRPLLIIDGKPLTPGFKEAEWAEKLNTHTK